MRLNTLKKIWIITLCLPVQVGVSQIGPFSLGIWHHTQLSGEVMIRGLYRGEKSLFNDIEEFHKSGHFMGGLGIHSRSYLWNPGIIKLDLDAEFYPETRQENYIQIPDRSEVRTLGKLGLNVTLFNNKPITLTSFANYDQSYFNRDYLTDIRYKNRQLGGMVSLNNKVLPVSITVRNQKWDQEEIQTGRLFQMEQTNFQGRATKSFGSQDTHELIYSYDDYFYNQAELYEVKNFIHRLSLDDNIYFDPKKKYNLYSRISYRQQEGNTELKRFEVIERLFFDLPKNFRFRGNFSHYNFLDPYQRLIQNRIQARLSQRLYQSLNTGIFVEYAQTNQSVYNESNSRWGFDLDYSKKIPTNGRLNLSYRYYRHHQEMESDASTIQVRDEEHILSDGEIVLLNKPYVDLLTVIAKDLSGTIIYQEGFDYILIERNNFIEIQRVLGGQIDNNDAILVDYQAQQPGSYEFDLNNHSFSASLLLFTKLLEVYYRGSIQDYKNLTNTDYLTLNYYDQHIAGVRFDVGLARAGVEYDHYNSSIIPYKLIRYYASVNWDFRSKLLLSFHGNLRDYLMINYVEKQKYTDLSGRVAYRIRPRSMVSLEMGYLMQRGRQLDLDMLTARAEYNTVYRQLYLKLGLEWYQRKRYASNYVISGAYVQLSRKF